MASTNHEFDKETVITINWLKRKNVSGMKAETSGKRMPRKIKIMLVNSLLRDLNIDIEVGRNG